VENAIDAFGDYDGGGDVVADEEEACVAGEGQQIKMGTGQEVVEADDAMALGEKALAHVGADESSGTGDHDCQRMGH
jgi:hypothetical protein